MERNQFFTTKKERYSLYLLALGGAVFSTVTGYFSTYLTDIGLAAGTVSLILLVTRVWDFMNDPLAGSIIEKAKFKSGKYIPWLKYSTVLLPIFGILMFLVPSSLPIWVKILVPTLLYVLYEGVFNFMDIPLFGIRIVTTNQVQERTHLASLVGLFTLLGFLIAGVTFPQIRTAMGWQTTAIIFGLVALVTIIWYPRVAKERFNVERKEPGFLEMFRTVAKNKQLIIFYVSLLVCMSTNYLQVIGLYVSRHVFGDEGYMSILYIAILVPAFVVAPFVPMLTKKIDKFTLFRFSLIGFALLGIASYFVGYQNLTLVFLFAGLRGVFFGVSSLLAYTFTPDMVEYEHYTKGERNEGVSFSFQTFTAKAVTALLSVTMMAFLSAFGFISGEGALQPDTVVTGIWALFTWIPAIGTLLSLVGFHFYKIRDKKVQVMIECNHGAITKEEAELKLESMGGY